MYGERDGSRVSVRVRENIAPISGRRVSRYAQRVITLANPLRSCACRRVLSLSSSSSLRRTVPTPSSSRSNGAAPDCTPVTCTFAPWRVSRDEEIRFAARENGVIIYEGGGGETGGVNHDTRRERVVTGRARDPGGFASAAGARLEGEFWELFPLALPRQGSAKR